MQAIHLIFLFYTSASKSKYFDDNQPCTQPPAKAAAKRESGQYHKPHQPRHGLRYRCERDSRGYDQTEICQRCKELGHDCNTIKRRVGRQAGVKNRKRKGDDIAEAKFARDLGSPPNPLRELAQAAPQPARSPVR